MKEQVIEKLKEMENNISVYTAFVNDMTNPGKDRSIVSFALLYEMLGFTAIKELVPDYVPSSTTSTSLAKGLGGVRGYTKIVDGKVVISSEYDQLLAMKEELLKKKQENGKVA